MVDIARYALIVYGVFMIVGGILGYVMPKTPSKISLIAGCVSGALSIVAFFIARQSLVPGLAIGLVVAAGVAVMMLPRIKTAKKPQSTIAIVALSAVTAVLVALGLALP